MPSASTPVLIVERNGELRPSEIKEHSQLELAKKCKYKTSAGFEVRAEWAYSGPDADKFIVELWAREDGTAGQENKYEFPPPVDTILFFGACALVAKDMTPQHNVIPLTLEKWDKMYNFLFGGFDTLTNCYDDDDDEYDELDSVPAHRKTKDGYLKDGFVVDEAEEEEEEDDEDEEDEDDTDETEYNDEEEPTTTDCEDNDESDDSYDTDDNDENDENDENGVKTKGVKGAKGVASKKKNTVIKKRGTEAAIPSFELMEEPYEYLDD